MHPLVEYSCSGGVARVDLAAEQVGNAVDLDTARALLGAVLRSKSDRARVIVLAARGRFFSVGGDLGSITSSGDPSATLLELAELAHRVIVELVRGEAIVVSVVQGTAAGIGFPLAAAADIVVASDSAKFSLAYARVGLSPDGGSSFLAATLGLHRVLRMGLLGDLLSAEEALEAGLAARVVPEEDLEAAVNEVVATLAAGSRAALSGTKRLLRASATPGIETALRAEAESISRLAGSADGQEGMNAFLSKRRPMFA